MLIQNTDKPREECGVFGIFANESLDCAEIAYHALYALQHRGQQACGIAVCDGENLLVHKDTGLVRDIFNDFLLSHLKGRMALGHVRYSGPSAYRGDAQPLIMRYKKGSMAIANNGGLLNADELTKSLESENAIFHTDTDAEIMAYMLARERIGSHSLEHALVKAMPKFKGAYSLAIMTPRKLIAARDPFGFRPLCIGKIGKNYVVASETVALDAVGAEFVRDVAAGEVVVIDRDGLHSVNQLCEPRKSAVCIFEFIYFARPDSVVDGQSVYEARKLAGKLLAKQHPVDADIVIGVPDSGLCAAIGYAEASGIPFGYGLIKNRYVGRAFIQPKQTEREKNANIKLNALSNCVTGKRVVMVDDSIIRGTTSVNIIKMLKDAGAKEVHMRISSPPFMWPCFFGTDIPDKKELAAVKYTQEEIKNILCADSLGYLSIDSLGQILPSFKGGYCAGCFTGKYPVDVPAEKLV